MLTEAKPHVSEASDSLPTVESLPPPPSSAASAVLPPDDNVVAMPQSALDHYRFVFCTERDRDVIAMYALALLMELEALPNAPVINFPSRPLDGEIWEILKGSARPA